MALSDYIVTDDLTIVLGLVAVALSLLHNLSKPQPLVHPILLGRQSDVARVRNPKESAVYRNYSTGIMGRVGTNSLIYAQLPDVCSSVPVETN
jgi:long-chain acyl-CoA synthetase